MFSIRSKLPFVRREHHRFTTYSCFDLQNYERSKERYVWSHRRIRSNIHPVNDGHAIFPLDVANYFPRSPFSLFDRETVAFRSIGTINLLLYAFTNVRSSFFSKSLSIYRYIFAKRSLRKKNNWLELLILSVIVTHYRTFKISRRILEVRKI